MTIKDAQELISAWEYKHPRPGGNETGKMAAISARAGELAETLSRSNEYPDIDRGETVRRMKEELTGLMWEVISMANEVGVDLTESLIDHLEQRNRRK